jgi:hypothetical protein
MLHLLFLRPSDAQRISLSADKHKNSAKSDVCMQLKHFAAN